MKAQEFLTFEYFKKDPISIWKWHEHFQKLVHKSYPNESHMAVADIQNFCEENDIKCVLITQVYY